LIFSCQTSLPSISPWGGGRAFEAVGMRELVSSGT
jgi:hypothetical protein